jgi:hypothetical protein
MVYVLKGKIIQFRFFRPVAYAFVHLCHLMHGIAIYINGLVGLGGTGMFAGPTTNTNFRVDLRYQQPLPRNHLNGFCGAMLGTGSAFRSINPHDAIATVKDNLANLGAFLRFQIQQPDCPCGANLATPGALVITETRPKVHVGLHDTENPQLVERWLQHMRRASRNAQMARSTGIPVIVMVV